MVSFQENVNIHVPIVKSYEIITTSYHMMHTLFYAENIFKNQGQIINPFMPSGLSYLNFLDRSISNRRGIG